MSILDDFKAVQDRLDPTIWYSVSAFVPSGKWLRVAATEFSPELHSFHLDDWAHVHRELTAAGYRLCDVREWRPAGAPAPTIIEGEWTT